MRASLISLRLLALVSVLCSARETLAAPKPAAPTVAMPLPQLLWPAGAPGALGDADLDKPALWVFLPAADKANGTAVVVCPGGGYGGLAIGHEGKDVADWLNSQGIAAFVLRYRLGPRYHHPTQLTDVQRALRTVRSEAAHWKVDPARIGVMGFSAGGHLASTLATHFDASKTDATDPIDQASCRPDFVILCYPVVALSTEYAHQGSKRNLLGENPDSALVDSLSNEKQVTSDTPPTFMFHTNADTGVPPENSVLFYMALRKAKVPAELHIYEPGRHGVGLALQDPILSNWPARLADWLRLHKLLEKK
jgi:acetyl esterase/lipase